MVTSYPSVHGYDEVTFECRSRGVATVAFTPFSRGHDIVYICGTNINSRTIDVTQDPTKT